MYKVKIGGDIHRGDLVAISNGNDFTLGIYYGQGRGGTFQYYTPQGVISSKNWWANAKGNPVYTHSDKPWALTRIWKSYVNTPRDTRILKLHRDCITDQEDIENIIKAKEILKEFNVEVNF
jgi:hypothetical protein